VDEVDRLGREGGPLTYVTTALTDAEIAVANAELLRRCSQARILGALRVTFS
jgi:hypothetical protein